MEGAFHPTYPNAKISNIQIPSPTGILFMVESDIGSTRIKPLPFVGGVVVGVKGTANGDDAQVHLRAELFGAFLVLVEDREIAAVGREVDVAVEPAVVHVLPVVAERLCHHAAVVVREAAERHRIRQPRNEFARGVAVVERGRNDSFADRESYLRAALYFARRVNVLRKSAGGCQHCQQGGERENDYFLRHALRLPVRFFVDLHAVCHGELASVALEEEAHGIHGVLRERFKFLWPDAVVGHPEAVYAALFLELR